MKAFFSFLAGASLAGMILGPATYHAGCFVCLIVSSVVIGAIKPQKEGTRLAHILAIQILKAESHVLKVRIKHLLRVINFYAARANWRSGEIDNDGGAVARAALLTDHEGGSASRVLPRQQAGVA